jgi:hypothetical protein
MVIVCLLNQRELLVQLAIITASRIASKSRFEYASRSIQSLTEHLGNEYPHYVVDDVAKLFGLCRHPIWKSAATKVYDQTNMHLRQRDGRASTSAALEALRMAKDAGAKLIFIHLDDNCYVQAIENLLKYANEAFESVPDLQIIRLGGGLLFGNDTDPQLGNQTHLKQSGDEVILADLSLKRQPFANFTLWAVDMDIQMYDTRVWPVAHWISLYRVETLDESLNTALQAGCRHLSDVELFYRVKENWQSFLQRFPGKLGYINMQYAGTEMERTKNWRAASTFPNKPIR